MDRNRDCEPRWCFEKKGIAEYSSTDSIPAAQIFKNGVYRNLVREILQNVIDARDVIRHGSDPAKARFEFMHLRRDEVPGVEELSKNIVSACKFARKRNGNRQDGIERFREANERFLMKGGSIPVLKISDFNTEGLTKQRYEGLIQDSGISRNNFKKGGSYGYGKFAPFSMTTIHTIIYVSRSIEGKYIFQSRTFLPAFTNAEGVEMKGQGIFGLPDEESNSCLPIIDEKLVSPTFKRDESGTDIYILCFTEAEDWKYRLAIEVLENFFFAIHENRLEVSIVSYSDGNKDSIVFNKSNLQQQLLTYEKLHEERSVNADDDDDDFTAPKFYRVLNDSEHKEIHWNFKEMGWVDIYILCGNAENGINDRSLLEMRSSGMKIQIYTGFRIHGYFNAVVVARGKENDVETDYHNDISMFLGKIEPIAHDTWDVDESDESIPKEDRVNAKRYVSDIRTRVKNEAKEMMSVDDEPVLDAFGMGRFLPDIDKAENGNNRSGEEAVDKLVAEDDEQFQKVNDNRSSANLESDRKGIETKRKSNGVDPSGKNNNHRRERKNSNRNNHHGPQQIHSGAAIHLERVRTPFDCTNGNYRISFTSTETVDNMLVSVDVTGENGSTYKTLIVRAEKDGHELQIPENKVLIGHVDSGEKVTFLLALSENREYRLKVSASVR